MRRSTLALALLCVSLPMLPSCEGINKQVSNVRGEVKEVLPYKLTDCREAVEDSIKALSFKLATKNVDAFVAIFEFYNAENTKITARLRKIDDKSTQLELQIGAFGDDQLGQMIVADIKKRL
ncbi:MAG: hypothetical protein RL095_2820 [Verrucomicrobiota bacterium]|jgi:hypothetical protein